MARSTIYKVAKRRKREGKTNYKKRLTLLLSHKPRLVIRKSNSNVTFQIVEYSPEGDKAIVTSHSKELKSFGYMGHGGNSSAGYLVGYLGGLRALKNKVDGAILDIGMVSSVKGSTVFAVLLGAVDAGFKVPHAEKILPPKEKFSKLESVKKKIAGAKL